MPLSDDMLANALKMVGKTVDEEVDCDTCLDGMSAFAENELRGLSIPEAKKAIEIHLALCPECAEEYEALLTAVKAVGEG